MRNHKYTLGTELRNTSREIVGIIIQANSARDKQPELLRVRERLEALLVLMRLAKEVRAFKSFAAYVHVVEMVGSISRQNEGWLRSVAQRTSRKQVGPESSCFRTGRAYRETSLCAAPA